MVGIHRTKFNHQASPGPNETVGKTIPSPPPRPILKYIVEKGYKKCKFY